MVADYFENQNMSQWQNYNPINFTLMIKFLCLTHQFIYGKGFSLKALELLSLNGTLCIKKMILTGPAQVSICDESGGRMCWTVTVIMINFKANKKI